MTSAFADLVAEAVAVSVEGWDFSWLAGRASEERPSWGYQRLIGERLAMASAALDIDTGGGEVLAGVEHFPSTMVATESWPSNLAAATRRLHPRGVVVVATEAEAPLPFADEAFDLVLSRHPVRPRFGEIARVLVPGGTYLAQHVGARSVFELIEHFRGPQSEARRHRDAKDEAAEARGAGLEIVELESARLRMEFYDVGAVVYFLRKVIWMVPDFTVEAYIDPLRRLHEQIEADGMFVAHSSRTLIEAKRLGR